MSVTTRVKMPGKDGATCVFSTPFDGNPDHIAEVFRSHHNSVRAFIQPTEVKPVVSPHGNLEDDGEDDTLADSDGDSIPREDFHTPTLKVNKIRVYVMLLMSRKSLPLLISPTTKGSTLRDFCSTHSGLAASEVRMICGGKQVEDDKSLAECGAKEGSTIHVVARQVGS